MKRSFSPTTQQEFDITTKHSMGSWWIDYLFQQIPFSPRRLCRGTAIASRPHVSSLSGLCSLVCSVLLVGYGVFKNTHKTHLDINGILNDIVYRCDITVKWVHVQCISLVSSICLTYKLWHKNNEIWIHGLLKTHETYIVSFYGFLNVLEGIVSTLPHVFLVCQRNHTYVLNCKPSKVYKSHKILVMYIYPHKIFKSSFQIEFDEWYLCIQSKRQKKHDLRSLNIR